MMAMSYGYVYVAQRGHGRQSRLRLLKAMTEAEAYHGPSLIIAYAPCINHGIKHGPWRRLEIKKAVECRLLAPCTATIPNWPRGQEPAHPGLQGAQAEGYQDFIKGEVRYASLAKMFPDVAQDLFNKNEADAMAKYAKYKRLAE